MKRVIIKDRVEPLIPRAVVAISEGGTMRFTVRNLFYKVREFFLTENFVCPTCGSQVSLLEFPDTFACSNGHTVSGDELRPLVKGLRFYLYNSFAQDFLTGYQKASGKIGGLLNEERGKLAFPEFDRNYDEYESFEHGIDTEAIDRFEPGVGNKVIMVEKMGLFHMMRANDFDRRLDAILICTEGFSTEAARLIMVGAAALGLPICILHDYDINGLLIHDTLLEPTKRRDSFIEGTTYNLGFTYEQLKVLMKRPEPVELKKGDKGKLKGLLTDAKISSEEYEFLLKYRVELNALTPLELLRWLEAELEQRDLWKTIPDEVQLREEAESQMRAELRDYRVGLASDVAVSILEELGLDRARELIDGIESYAQDRAMEEIGWPYVESEASVDELVKRLKERPFNYWKHTARVMGLEESAPFKDEMDGLVDEGKERWAQKITQQEPVQDKLGEIREALT
ncbi:hypothetical protein ES703_84795 [subsurface metagenome]